MRKIILKILVFVFLHISLFADCSFEYESEDAQLRTLDNTVVDYFSIEEKEASEKADSGCALYTMPYISYFGTSCVTDPKNVLYPRCPEGQHLVGQTTCAHYECDSGYKVDGDKCVTDCSYYGYTQEGNKCVKTYHYNYYEYFCSTETNHQGFMWEMQEAPTSDGVKVDSDILNKNYLGNDIISHLETPECKRKYQVCTMECPEPLTLDSTSGKCVADYASICEYKGLVYNEESKKCEKENQCIYDSAVKDSNSSYCVMIANCGLVEDGVCANKAIKTCSTSGFIYNGVANICQKPTACSELEYVLDDGLCGSSPYCNGDDVQSKTECLNTVNVEKSCAPDSREGNLCFVSNGVSENSKVITTQRPLIKTELEGSFKLSNYGTVANTLCTDNSYDCQFRLVKIEANEYGNKLCFTDAQGVNSCISISEGCEVTGSIESDKGIKQLKIESGNKIVAYDLAHTTQSLGSIHSTCSLSGKVGNFEGEFISSDITSIKTDGLNMLFWDSFKRGFIGVISFLPTIPDEDLKEGYVYGDNDVYTLLTKGFTAFYSEDSSSVFGVFNGFISKENCLSLINDTSFYIVQPQTEEEKKIVSALNFKSGNDYNFNDGDIEHGSCVIRSNISQSFSEQEFSVKTVYLNEDSSVFVCSPFSCVEHYCQYNQCPSNYTGTLYDQSYFDEIVEALYPNVEKETICTNQLCDSNRPYFNYCGNNMGCEIRANVYQQSDGSCVEVTCDEGDQLDLSTGKCIGYGCYGSIERDGKCYKTLY